MVSKKPPLDPRNPGLTHLAEAYRLYDADDFNAALAECDATLTCLPMLAEAHNLRGVVLEELGQGTEAIAAYRKALQLEPDFAEPRENLRQIEAEQGRLAEAYRQLEGHNFAAGLAECDAALLIIPTSAEAHNLRGVFLEELGRPLEALQAYETALQLDPNLADAVENLQGIREEWGDLYGLVTIAASDSVIAMHILASRLAAEGIPSHIANEEMIVLNWLYNIALGGAQLQVRRQDAERAQRILRLGQEDIESEDERTPQEATAGSKDSGAGKPIEIAGDEISDPPLSLEEISALAAKQASAGLLSIIDTEIVQRCPKCNSLDLKYQKYRQRLVFSTWLVLGWPLPFTLHKWQCLACGHEWRRRP